MKFNSIYLLVLTVFSQSFIFILIFSNSLCNSDSNQDYYQLLGISKDADNRDIRKAFKKLALTKHPDKNQNDPKAHENFLKITRAYEILKDDEMRKKYDMFGEEGLKEDGAGSRGHYHSWNYYNEDFGIYDNDEEIITLSRTDFEQSVTNSPYFWFINYYSPQCSHCHHLAPDWRKLAKELDGVIRIGAVNCEEDWQLCREQSIRSYPSLIFYPEYEKYSGNRDTDSLVEYVLNKLEPQFINIDKHSLSHFLSEESNQELSDILPQKSSNLLWLLIVCYENKDCLFSDTQKMLSIMLENVVNVGLVFCDNRDKVVCDHFGIHESKVALFPDIKRDKQNYYQIIGADQSVEAKHIFRAILSKLPNVKKLTQKDLKSIWDELSVDPFAKPWIVEFTTTEKDIESNQMESKRLISLLSDENIVVGKIFCDKESKACSQFYIHKYPTYAVLKGGANYELYHGRILAFDIANFAKESLSSRLQTLDPNQFEEKVTNPLPSDKPWFVDFFAPWCPPCMRLMPEIRKASRSVNHLVNFGTIDCTIHTIMCRKYNIRSYPTVLLYNSSVAHQFHGSHSEKDLIDFIQETLSPTVMSLTPNTFNELVTKKKPTTLWLVDFYAPWCGPCQRLAPQWTKLAKMLKEESNIKVGKVDCQQHSSFCSESGVRSYPTLRLYPSKDSKYYSKNQNFYAYNGQNRDAESLRVWVYNFIPSVVKEFESEDSYKKALKSKEIWLIDYYAPWCSHCTYFAPEFEIIAKKLKGRVKCGKVNCQDMRGVCRDAVINAYPTIKLYTKSSKKDKSVVVEGFVAKDMVDFVNNQLSSESQSNSIREEL